VAAGWEAALVERIGDATSAVGGQCPRRSDPKPGVRDPSPRSSL